MEVPYFPLHTQSCERVVKQVTLWFSESERFYRGKNRAQRCCSKFEIQERFYENVELMLTSLKTDSSNMTNLPVFSSAKTNFYFTGNEVIYSLKILRFSWEVNVA